MNRTVFSVIYLIIMIATVVTVDLLFLRDHTTLRLLGNIGIVLLFVAGYFALSRRFTKSD